MEPSIAQNKRLAQVNGTWTRAKLISRTLKDDDRRVIGLAVPLGRVVVVDTSTTPALKVRYKGSKDETPLVRCIQASDGQWLPFELLDFTPPPPPPASLFEKPIADGAEILGEHDSLEDMLLAMENDAIRRALAANNRLLTRAADTLKMSYQALAYIINSRHRDLISERTPVKRRAAKHPGHG